MKATSSTPRASRPSFALPALASLALVVACTGAAEPEPPTVTHSAQGESGKPCKRSSDCATGICVPRMGEVISDATAGVCSHACKADGDCVAGWSCIVGPAGADVCQCKASSESCDGLDNDCNGVVDDMPNDLCHCAKTVCGGACIDTSSDAANCGSCGKACGANAACAGGVCVCGSAASPCDTTDGKHLCGQDGRCHEDVWLTHENPWDTSYGYVQGAVHPASTYVVYEWRANIAREARTLIERVRFAAPSGGVAVTYGTFQANAHAAADGDDFVYAMSAYQDFSGAKIPARLVACPGGVCGATLFDGEVGRPLRMSGGKVYWMRGGMLFRCALAGCGGTPEELGAAPTDAAQYVVDGGAIYALSGGSVLKWTEATGTFAPLFAAPGADAIAVDDTTVYVGADAGVLSCAKTGCASPATVAAVGHPSGIAARGDAVHWVSGGQLYRCAKGASCVPALVAGGVPSIAAEDATHLYVPRPPGVRRISK